MAVSAPEGTTQAPGKPGKNREEATALGETGVGGGVDGSAVEPSPPLQVMLSAESRRSARSVVENKADAGRQYCVCQRTHSGSTGSDLVLGRRTGTDHPQASGLDSRFNACIRPATNMDLGAIPGWLFRPPIRRTT